MNKLNKILLGFLFACAVVIPFREVKAINWLDTANSINYVYSGSYGTPSVSVPPISYSSTNGGTFTVDPGFIISSYTGCSDTSHPELCSTSYTNHVINGAGDTKALYLSTGDVFNVFWREDGHTYPVNYSITGQGAAYPPVCTGGRVTNVTCVPESSNWTTETCPYQTGSQGFICPIGTSYNESSAQTTVSPVVFNGIDVQISVTPVLTGKPQTTDATIKYGEGVKISWTTTNASEMTSCECTPDCGTSTGPTFMYYDQKIGPNEDGVLFPSTSTKYTVKCE